MKEYYLIKYNNNIIGCYNNYSKAEIFILSLLQNNFISNNNNNIQILTYINNSCYCIKTDNFKLSNESKYIKESNSLSKEKEFNQIKNINETNQALLDLLNSKATLLNETISLSKEREIIELEKNAKAFFPNETNQAKIELLNSKTTLLNEIKNEQIIELIIEDKKKEDIIEKINELGNKKIEIQHNINILKCRKERNIELKNIYDCDIKLYEMFKNSDKEIPKIFLEKYKIMNKLNNENNLNFDNFIKEYSPINNYDLFPLNNYENKFENNYDKEIQI